MFIPIFLAVVTILSVIFALRKKRPLFLALPLVAMITIAFIKIMSVPLPFWETVQFIFNLRG
ncbi:hypothetical protein LCL89_14520 [Halobacillus yeomjeoni]|uniref:Uncharacterized protein n=1 Tax=Halobacillus yeomjeoni TaxID=311194 RepID=A0A931HWC2_9BACI|nr:hypothetical protein [Halobacillus yeomjeoni]MBH0230673.1 hypothetical protein [Halobacillus yeomjeoni]MCA0985244.1 hypothetical protein [Halobacillus yeomjeoni]